MTKTRIMGLAGVIESLELEGVAEQGFSPV